MLNVENVVLEVGEESGPKKGDTEQVNSAQAISEVP